MRELLKRSDLDEFQVAAGLFLERVGSCALWIDMGLGKTVVVLTHVSDKVFSAEWSRVLVVGPPLVVSDTWSTEVQNWEHTRWLAYQELDGTPENMRAQLQRPCEIDGISVHKLDRLAPLFKRGDKVPWDAIVFDESSMFRNKTAKRWRHAIRLTWGQDNDVIQLTGTPSPNGLQQVWAQIAMIDGGERLGLTYKGFLFRFFKQTFMGRKVMPKSNTLSRITKLLGDIVYTLREEDYVKLPPLRSTQVPIILPPDVLRKYQDFERTSVLQWGKEDDPKVRALSEGALYGKLLQFACGRIYTDPDTKAYADIHDKKIERLKEIVEFSDGSPILVARTWQHSRDRLRDEFPGIRSMKTQRDLDDWKAGRIQIAETHPASIGHGTNIQSGGHNLIWYDHTPDLELYMQLRKRLHRRGQTASHVNMMHLTAVGTIEEDLTRQLAKKEITQDALREPMRRRVADVQRELANGRT